VLITGFPRGREPYLSACNVVCLCSLTEALSLAAIEAMAMARPLVHSQVGGATELIEPGATDCCFRREIPPRWLTACSGSQTVVRN